MFSLLPSDWEQPRPFWMKKPQNYSFIPPDPPINPEVKPVPIIEPQKPKTLLKVPVIFNEINEKLKEFIPECELCLGEDNDFTEIDRMLANMDLESGEEISEKDVLGAVKRILGSLEKNIKNLEESEADDGISKEELLNLLKTFAESYRSILTYLQIKIKEEKQPWE